MRRLRVIGCGNLYAGDDAAGILAVREARGCLSDTASVEVIEVGSAVNVVHFLNETDVAIVVDAVHTPGGGRPPGSLLEVEVGPKGRLADWGSSLSSHGFGLADSVGLAAALGGTARVLFVGVEASDVRSGRPLSPAVEAALPGLVYRILELVREVIEGLSQT